MFARPLFCSPLSRSVLLLAAVAVSAPALAQPGWGGGWGGGWGRSGYDNMRMSQLNSRSSGRDSREGKVQAEQFPAADAGDLLGKGQIVVTTLPGTTTDASDSAPYEAAVIDQLVKAGYDTMKPDPQGGQVVELRIVRDTLVPEEEKHKPVSGEATMGVSNRGSMMGMAIAVDLSKPRKALISTKLEATVRDKATNKPLWEGRAEIATREGDDKWNDQAIATRLAAAMFDHFPTQGQGKVASRQ